MILALRISSMLALTLGGVLLVAAGLCWRSDNPRAARTRNLRDLANRFVQADDNSAESPAMSVLVAQAEAFAAHLNPSPEPDVPASPANIAPQSPAAAIKLHATSYYPDQPAQSMALVSGEGARTKTPRWVKEGSEFGPFHIHEIRRGGIVYRQNDQFHEVAIDHNVDRPSIVRDTRAGSHRVSAAMGDGLRRLHTPAGPNDIEISGN
jgi:hypothetical protein